MSQFYIAPVAVSIPFDNETNNFVATDVQAAIEEARATVPYLYVSNVTTVSTTSATDVVLTGMSVTPPAGNYIVTFSCDTQTDGVNAAGEFSLYNGATRVPESIRGVQANTAILGVVTLSTSWIACSTHSQAVITADGVNPITAQFKRVAAGGAIYSMQRNMVAIRIL